MPANFTELSTWDTSRYRPSGLCDQFKFHGTKIPCKVINSIRFAGMVKSKIGSLLPMSVSMSIVQQQCYLDKEYIPASGIG